MHKKFIRKPAIRNKYFFNIFFRIIVKFNLIVFYIGNNVKIRIQYQSFIFYFCNNDFVG